MAKFNIPIILGTRRKDNLSSRVAEYIVQRLGTYNFIDTPLLDLTTYDFPILEERIPEMEVLPAGLQEFCAILQAADAVIIVSPEYKNGVPGGLKNALDYLPPGHFQHKPIGICTVSSGPYGGLNCLAQLRLICISMAGVVIPERFPVSYVQDVFDSAGNPTESTKMGQLFDRFWKDLLWHTEALTDKRKLVAAALS